MTFYLTCSQGHQRGAVMKDVTIVQVMSPATAATRSFAGNAKLDLSVAAGSKGMF